MFFEAHECDLKQFWEGGGDVTGYSERGLCYLVSEIKYVAFT